MRYEKPLKKHPLQVEKYVETYSSSNADPEERVKLQELKNNTTNYIPPNYEKKQTKTLKRKVEKNLC